MTTLFSGLVPALLVLTLGASPGSTATREGPAASDLRVARGAVGLSGDQLTGVFDVRNAGASHSAPTWARLVVRVAGRDRGIRRFAVAGLSPGRSWRVRVRVPLPSYLPAGQRIPLRVCLTGVTGRCRRVGVLVTDSPTTPDDPIDHPADEVFTVGDTAGGTSGSYWAVVPHTYDGTGQTPTSLLVWLHGCGARSQDEIYTAAPAARGYRQGWIAIAPSGREVACWDPRGDQEKVLAAIADARTHFNIDPRRVVVGGFSSGGNLAYRFAFEHALSVAGVLAINTGAFQGTGLSQDQALAAAAWKFHVVHLAHTEDDAYDIATVRRETDALAAAGFPAQRIERPGPHWERDTATTGTKRDTITYLLPHMYDGWTAPRPGPDAGRVVRRAARPDLVITQGSTRTRQDRLVGSFVIVNRGYAPAAASRARITVRIDGVDRLLARYDIARVVEAGARRLELDVALPRGRQSGRAVVTACVDVRRRVAESSERNNCHRMGTVAVQH